jgi:hypothetical protein
MLRMVILKSERREFRKKYLPKRKSRQRKYGFKKHAAWFKGMVSRDWGRLQMVLLDRSEVRRILLNVYFLI